MFWIVKNTAAPAALERLLLGFLLASGRAVLID
jgi:hypothetical protein